MDYKSGLGVTPIARRGGKSKLANKLINLFPEFKTYVEPFLGAGNVFLRIPEDELNNKKIVLNDLDKDIYTIFTGIKKRGKYINNNINRNQITKEEFKELKNKTDVISVIERYKNSFFGQGKVFATTYPDQIIKTNYEVISHKLKNAIILNESFETVIKAYDSQTTFFYLDPPYESIKKNDYLNYVEPEDIYNSIKNIKGKFLLSYNDSSNIRKIFNKYFIYEIETSYSHTKYMNPRRIKELIITNYDLE